MTKDHNKIQEAIQILAALGLPKQQQNERSALCLLALLNITHDKQWSEAEAPLIGITPIMDWAKAKYQKEYAPNTRETVRRFSMHQFVAAGIAAYNPDDPSRAVNSPKAVYQITPETLELLRTFDTPNWQKNLRHYLKNVETLASRNAKARKQKMIPVNLSSDSSFSLSPGKHSELIKAIIEDFGARFVPGGSLIYAGDTGDKWGYFDEVKLSELGVTVDAHGKMPDVALYYPKKDWLVLVEAVTSHGPVDSKRHEELKALFAGSSAGLVFVSAFLDRATMRKYLGEIAWETEVWVADAPSHLIHFNGERFLGPYA